MMEGELEAGRKEMEECERVRKRAEEFLKGVESGGVGGEENNRQGTKGARSETKDKNEEARRLLWGMMMDIDVQAD